mgnify:CR=1 FL=1
MFIGFNLVIIVLIIELFIYLAIGVGTPGPLQLRPTLFHQSGTEQIETTDHSWTQTKTSSVHKQPKTNSFSLSLQSLNFCLPRKAKSVLVLFNPPVPVSKLFRQVEGEGQCGQLSSQI